jgi:hypothetical protein
MNTTRSYLIVGCVSLWLLGCGSRTIYPVTGNIVYKHSQAAARDLAGYLVTLESLEKPVGATGTVREDGSFEISTENSGDGALLGKHKVAITPPIPTDVDNLRPVSVLPRRYEKFQTSGLEIVVEAKTNVVELIVEKQK